MAQSLPQVYIHIIFSTKHRRSLIDDAIEKELFAYLGGICNSLECPPLKVGGYRNHVHILCKFSKKVTIIKLLEELKKSSSNWIKTKGSKYSNFYWQGGYAVFSVNPKQIPIVQNYIENQREHHRKRTFKEECRTFFENYKVEYDERYVWG